MYVQVRTADGKQNTIITISKFTSVLEFKELIEQELHIIAAKQRLFFRGKQLENEHCVCDYDVNVNDVIQLMIRPDEISCRKTIINDCSTSKADVDQSLKFEESYACDCKYFKVGDIVDAKDHCYGAWFEGKIIGIFKNQHKPLTTKDDCKEIENDIIYKVLLNRYPYSNPLSLSLKEIRPRARRTISAPTVKIGDVIMVNYNIDQPSKRGFWYDLLVTSITLNKSENSPKIRGKLYFGMENNVLNDCKIKFIDDIMSIEEKMLIIDRSEKKLIEMQTETIDRRISAAFCERCKDKTDKCTYCNCHICGFKTEPEKQLVCDECNMMYHIWCLTPPLDEIPEVDDWYCMECKHDENEIVKAGQKLKNFKTDKSKSRNSRNKGRGMACVGRSKDCTIVPLDHFGAIPGIEVGTTWKFRMQVAESGVHRPHVAGIHGRECDGAYSIVLSGGYEDDMDDGDEIIYTGSGGRDLTGRRTAQQSSDQTLTRLNKALAVNCNVDIDPINGAEAKDWRQGKPVRVVRNFRSAKHSKYAPKEGNRYDGLYKVVKYYPEKGKSGYLVWRYLLRRDDPSPAPWTKEGKNRIKSLGMEIIYPDGFIKAMVKEKENHPYKNKRKSKFETFYFETKRPKCVAFTLEANIQDEIENDNRNAKIWKYLKSTLHLGQKIFLSKVKEEFTCICCQELIFQPVTMLCNHNICMACIKQSFAAKIYSCPYCRSELGKNYGIVENKHLQNILSSLFPGYSAGR